MSRLIFQNLKNIKSQNNSIKEDGPNLLLKIEFYQMNLIVKVESRLNFEFQKVYGLKLFNSKNIMTEINQIKIQ